MARYPEPLCFLQAGSMSSGAPTGGTFTLTFGGQTTGAIAYNASAATVQTALTALSSIGSGNVVVTAAVNGGWEVRFAGTLGSVFQTQMTASGSGLTGGLRLQWHSRRSRLEGMPATS